MSDSSRPSSEEHLRPAVLMVLDVDGTISRIYPQDEYAKHHDDPDCYEWLPLDEAVVDAIDALAQRPGDQIAWLTSWAPNQDYLDNFIDVPRLHGRLYGACIPWIDSPAEDGAQEASSPTPSECAHTRSSGPMTVRLEALARRSTDGSASLDSSCARTSTLA